MGRCTLCFHGGDPRVSPFLHHSLPGYSFDVTEQHLSEDRAYRLCWPMSQGTWRKSDEDDSGFVVEGHARLVQWGVGGSYALCGSRGCMRSCFDHFERTGKIGPTFVGGPFIRRERWLLPSRVPPRSASRRS